MKVCMSGCLPPDPHNLKFGVGSSFHPGWKPGQAATPNIDPRPFLLLKSICTGLFHNRIVK
jgi:hypothetical protein